MIAYFEDCNGLTIAIVAKRITAIEQNRLPTDTPVTICIDSGAKYRVRGGFDTAQRKVLEAFGKEST